MGAKANGTTGRQKVTRGGTQDRGPLLRKRGNASRNSRPQKESHFHTLVRATTDAILVVDAAGIVLFSNRTAAHMFGRSARALTGKSFGVPLASNGLTEVDILREDGTNGIAEMHLAPIHWRGSDCSLAILQDITERKRAEVRLRKSESRLALRTRQLELLVTELKKKNVEVETHAGTIARDLREKEALLREVYHRVKNNLQVVQSLINIGSRRLEAESAEEIFESVIDRVHVMAMVHERLYASSDLASNVELSLEADSIPLTLEIAIPFGMLVHELVSNSLKHAFRGRSEGRIAIRAQRVGDCARLSIHDNGNGLPQDFDPKKCRSMGIQLAASFAHQLGGELRFQNVNGTLIEVELTRI
jgi:two-component sensor histidine kinase